MFTRPNCVSFHHVLAAVIACCYGVLAPPSSAEEVIRPLVPGFVVEELPITLPNVNNLRFSPNGDLLALGYNGHVYVLRDRDGDGIEEQAIPYWDKDTLSVPVGMAWSKEGLYVSSHGKVSLLIDSDGDLRADVEKVVAQGWPPTDVASGGVDATAVTLDAEGNLYFGLMCVDYSNPYRVQADVAKYDKNSLRGSIVRLARGQTKLETICTGVRVPYTLAFNRAGDLFLTDQEGATWLPGGNPLDELNHIQPGRHYGFPPRHAEYLPDVVDEPPIVGFGPQHQSTTGLVFNEANESHRSFGPKSWQGDALVTGFSRGKLWRVRLVKTEHGYVGRPSLVAVSTMLLADAAISPRGDLYLCCHSGPPDWGTGPQGEGKLFRVRYLDATAPQPVVAWSASPLEVRVAFDRPVSEALRMESVPVELSYGENVRAGDRFESLKPPYAAVEDQGKSHRGKLHSVGGLWSVDGRMLSIATDPHPLRAGYSLTIPMAPAGPTHAIDMEYSMHGVQATWQSAAAQKAVSKIWLPHIDLNVAGELTVGSVEHEQWFQALRRPGELTIEGTVDLPTTARLTISSDRRFELQVEGGRVESSSTTTAGQVATVAVEPGGRTFQFVALTSDDPMQVHASYHTDLDPTERGLRLEQLLVPWAPPLSARETTVASVSNARVEGDPANGEQLFFGSRGKCSTCHAVRGRGATFAPDLGNHAHRDQVSVLRDIREPSVSINPDFVSYSLALHDGRALQGIVKADGADRLRVVDTRAKETIVDRNQVESIAPATTSAMPTGLLDGLSGHEVHDLLAFLLTEPISRSAAGDAFPVRSDEEVRRVSTAAMETPIVEKSAPLNITLVAGKQDHGPGEHDYPAWQSRWQALLSRAADTSVGEVEDWPTPELWQRSDVVICYCWNHNWSQERFAEIDAFLKRGGGLVVLHSAMISDDDPEALAERLGLAAQPVRSNYRHGPLELHITNDKHPLTMNFEATPFVDETYWPLIGDRGRVTVLATAVEEGQEHPMVWTHEVGDGRVFASVLGHYTATMDDPLFRILVLRGIAWAAQQPIARFEDLVRPTSSP